MYVVGTAGSQRLDFFISFAAPDIAWARWIGWTLEDAGYRVLCQEQDMRPGHNAVHQMQLGTAAARTLAVFSPDYFGRPYPESEWSAAYVADPVGIGRKLIPVMVRPCHPPGLLRAIVYIDLVGVSRPAARRRLLASVTLGRPVPADEPEFPGDR